MRINKIEIQNFRLLEKDICVNIEDDITLIVGRNNSGKTSFIELLNLFLNSEKKQLLFEDFSIGCHGSFKEAHVNYKSYLASKESTDSEEIQSEKMLAIEKALPKIELKISITYDKDDNLASLAPFIMDLNPERTDAQICLQFKVKDALRLFKYFELERSSFDNDLIKYLHKNINAFFETKVFAIDAQNQQFFKEIEHSSIIDNIFLTRMIEAQRPLDDTSKDNKGNLSKGFSRYYKFRDKENINAKNIELSLSEVQKELKGKYNVLLSSVLSDLENFGAKTPITIPSMVIESEFDSEKVLENNIKYYYTNESGLNLPERYNGLGYSNLIFMVLQFFSFFEEFRNREQRPEFLLILLEEPEAHMHPQMQQVFIKNINKFIQDENKKPENKEKQIKVQIIISTHSSHIIAEVGIDEKIGFKRIRFFDNRPLKFEVKDFSDLKIQEAEEITVRFLKQYLTLHKCDLFFADKIILVEGTTERLLLPLMIQKVSPELHSEYISIVEVGGAYAHKFKDFLSFLGVKTLIITDIDAVNKNGRKCKVSNGVGTSNQTLKQWIPNKSLIEELMLCKAKEKTNGNFRVAYQIKEDTDCGRSFEEAFILRNANILANNKSIKKFKKNSEDQILKNAYTFATMDSTQKTQFAFDIMTINEIWNVPSYIEEGLLWLASQKENVVETAI